MVGLAQLAAALLVGAVVIRVRQKLTKLVPCVSSCAIQALLSPAAERWQSVQVLVSRARTVCGTCGLNAWLLKPGAEIGGCCM